MIIGFYQVTCLNNWHNSGTFFCFYVASLLHYKTLKRSTCSRQAGRRHPMKTRTIKREIVTLVMESPLYFTIPLPRRLQFIKFLSQQAVFRAIFDLQLRQATQNDDLNQSDSIRALDKFSVVSVGRNSSAPYSSKIPWKFPGQS